MCLYPDVIAFFNTYIKFYLSVNLYVPRPINGNICLFWSI